MKEILGFIREYAREVNKQVWLGCTLFIAVLIWLNYRHGLEKILLNESSLPWSWISGHYLIFLAAFLFPHLWLLIKRKELPSPAFTCCLLIAPLIFAIKVSMNTEIHLSANGKWNQYWNDVLYWPPRFIVLFFLLAIMWLVFHKEKSFYGLKPKKINFTPYLLMLLIMVPLITAASTQHDFLLMYPKMKEVLPLPTGAIPGWVYKLLFELSYGNDFLSIELFFRGFLIIGFIKWAGKDAILPMACFYCTIHFGKPLGECISSYFGGMLLGIVSYHTRSVYGGLIVHLGIAWLMEIGGYIGNL
jgi:Type II CAAX prenyl endopeptidase Rce1-like